MNQQEFDKQVCDILSEGLDVRNTREKIKILYVSLKDEEKKLAFDSNLLGLWMKANMKELTKIIIGEPELDSRSRAQKFWDGANEQKINRSPVIF